MNPDPLDAWKLPALDDLGEQIRHLEQAERAKAKRRRLRAAPALANRHHPVKRIVSIRLMSRWRIHVAEALVLTIFVAIAVLTIIAIVNGEDLPS